MNEIGTNNLTGSLMQCLEKAFSAGAFQLSLSPLFFHQANEMGVAKKIL